MKDPIVLEIPSSGAEEWLSNLKSLVPHEKTRNGIIIDNAVGYSSISLDRIQPGLSYALIDMKSKLAFRYVRKRQNARNRFSIVITLNKAPFKVKHGSDGETIDLDHPAKAMILSPQAEVSVDVPSGNHMILIIIFLDDQWINQNLTDDNNQKDIEYLLNLNRPAVLYQQVDINHNTSINQIMDEHASKINKLSSFISLISSLFTRFIDKEGNQKRKMKSDDADSIIHVCNLIEMQLGTLPPLTELAKEAGMSLSKFKYAFKYVTGYTPYQYHLKYKMDKAKELLLKTDKSVSEIGYICGYTNLSHFSRVFKRFHNVLPSKI